MSRLGLAGCLALSLLSLAAVAAEPQPDGTPIKVTPRMRGAGVVSSGVTLPPAPPATGTREHPVPSWGKPLPFPIIIADRHNNRILEVAPDKHIIWEFTSPSLKVYRANDDAFFSPDGKEISVNEEDNYDIHIVDYATRSLIWSYGESDTFGKGEGLLNFPDDVHILPDGRVMTADIRNCRVLFIDREKESVLSQWGKPGTCRHDPPRFLNLPNGSTPLDNGDILITEIPGSWITRLTLDGKVVWSRQAPHVSYPSDAYMTHDGQVIVANYAKPGGVVVFDPGSGKVTWEHSEKKGEKMLVHPSLAMELPTGDILLNDDERHRVIVIDRKTKQIIWQYGVTDQPGHAPGYLFYPDGLDIDVYHDWKTTLAGHD